MARPRPSSLTALVPDVEAAAVRTATPADPRATPATADVVAALLRAPVSAEPAQTGRASLRRGGVPWGASPGPGDERAAAGHAAVVGAAGGHADGAPEAAAGVQAIELQLGHFCNNRCVFCASGQLTERGLAAPVPAERVAHALRAAAAQGVRRVTFLGGEPTVQASFLPSLALAQELGLDDITVFTNGARFGDAAFMAEALARGRLTWRISIQGGDEASHDAAVGQRGAWAKILRGLALLRAAGARVEVNVCLTTGSLASLPALADIVLEHGVAQLCVDMLRPVSAGERSDRWLRAILPRFQAVAPAVAALLDRIEAADPAFDVAITHLPFCALPGRADRISHGGESTVTFTADPEHGQGAQDKYAFQASDRTHVPACEACLFRRRCSGVPWHYLALFGDAELRAVTPESLPALDPSGRAVVDGHAAAVAALPAALRPWHVEAAEDPRQRLTRLRFRGPAWAPPGLAGALVDARLQSASDPLPPGFVAVGGDARSRLALAPVVINDVAALASLAGHLCAALGLPALASAPSAAAWRSWLYGRRWLEALAADAVLGSSPPGTAQLAATVVARDGGAIALRPAHDPSCHVWLSASLQAPGVAVLPAPSTTEALAGAGWAAFSRALGAALRASRPAVAPPGSAGARRHAG